MLDYCSSNNSSPRYQSPSPTMTPLQYNMSDVMNSANMNMAANMAAAESQRQSAFVLGSQPLAALHSMTEMKTPTSSSSPSAPNFQNPYTSYAHSTLKHLGLAMSQASTSHRISDILNRPLIQNPLGLPQLNTGMYLNSQGGIKLAELPGRPPIYWPGVVGNPVWRPNGKYYSTHYQRMKTFDFTEKTETLWKKGKIFGFFQNVFKRNRHLKYFSFLIS